MNNSRLICILLLLGLVVGVTLAMMYRDRFDGAALEAWIRNIELIAPVLFVPGSVIALAGGALFGPVLGTLVNLTGATLGAALAFCVFR